MEADYKVKLDVFEGPLDLLLYLIKQDEIDIYDISLERITRQYLEYLQAFKELNIELAGEWFQVDLEGLEQPGHHSPVSDRQDKFDDLRRAQVLLQSFHGLPPAFYVDCYLIGQLQNQPLQLAEAFGAAPILDRRDLLLGHAYVPGSRHVLGPFVN